MKTGTQAHDFVWRARYDCYVCSRCGGVRNLDRTTPCRGVLPRIEPRGAAADEYGENT